MPNLRSKVFIIFFFTMWSGLWIFWGEGVQAPTFSGHIKFQVKKFSEFFVYRVLLTLNLSVVWATIFWSCQIRGQKVFRIFSLTKGSGLNFSEGVSGHRLFLVMSNLKSESFWNFFTYRALWTLKFLGGGWGSGHQLFLVMLNLRSKIFHNFFIYQALWTLNLSGGSMGPSTNFFCWC